MGISLSQALAAKRAVRVVVATNQENGTVSYHTGTLRHEEAGAIGPYFRPARLTTSGGKPLTALFSDRFVGVSSDESIAAQNPFSISSSDEVGLSISRLGATIVAKFTLIRWGNASYQVALAERGKLLEGAGAVVGNSPGDALYIVSLQEAPAPR
nr:hypothetical protein [Caldimonas sp.]